MLPGANIINYVSNNADYNIDSRYYEYIDSKQIVTRIEIQDEMGFQILLKRIKRNEEKRRKFINLIESQKTPQERWNQFQVLSYGLSTLTVLHQETLFAYKKKNPSKEDPRYISSLTLTANYIEKIYKAIGTDTVFCFVSDTGI